MSSGPEHYSEAERLLSLALAPEIEWDIKERKAVLTGRHVVAVDDGTGMIANTIAAAQAHATLALAAAQIEAAKDLGPAATAAWDQAVSA